MCIHCIINNIIVGKTTMCYRKVQKFNGKILIQQVLFTVLVLFSLVICLWGWFRLNKNEICFGVTYLPSTCYLSDIISLLNLLNILTWLSRKRLISKQTAVK